jgi:vitamin B12 transporter
MLFDGVLETIAGASFTRTKVNDFTSPFGAPFDVSFNDRTEGGENRFDLQTNIRWSPNQRLSLLAETVRDTFDSLRLDLPSAGQSQHETHSGVAAEYWIGIDDAVFVSLGARHDWNEVFADTTTWRATVSARLDPAVRLHASAGTGVKNPDFFELFGFFPAPAFEGNPNLKPEKSLGFDGGLEWRVAPDVIVDATYFHTDLEDEIFTDFSVFPNTARNASGESLRQGVEVSAHAKLIDGLTLDAAYTYLDAKENGAPEIRRPHHIASANLDWRFAEDRGLINLGIDYHGRQRDTAFLNAPPFTMPVTLDRYTLVHIAGSYEICPGFALTARVENALDVSYEEVFGYRTQGFGAFAGVKVRFGG